MTFLFWATMFFVWCLFMTEGVPAIQKWWVQNKFRRELNRRDDFPVE